ncbi:uncharacterized protein [Typha latifolia]|uniref:uncharacterized protein n=1 Tax=Typha latifolia TaxID=4733 RepID=UPI003C2E925A
MSTLFVALQCFQCSTLQVKQQSKKSSSKWVCAVCNQRQPVRRIHARGPLASDLRRYVQSFNMSRGSDGPDLIPPPYDGSRESGDAWERDCTIRGEDRFKKRMDWSEYLDPKEEDGEDGDGKGNEVEVHAVTEWPQEMFKISSQECPARASKPELSKRKRDEESASSRGNDALFLYHSKL